MSPRALLRARLAASRVRFCWSGHDSSATPRDRALRRVWEASFNFKTSTAGYGFAHSQPDLLLPVIVPERTATELCLTPLAIPTRYAPKLFERFWHRPGLNPPLALCRRPFDGAGRVRGARNTCISRRRADDSRTTYNSYSRCRGAPGGPRSTTWERASRWPLAYVCARVI